MKNLFGVFTKLIKPVLCGEDPNGEFEFSDAEIAEIFDLSLKHDIVQIAGHALKNGGYLLGSDFEAVFTNYIMAAVFRYEKMKYELERINKIFNEEQIEFVPLKGSVLREYYSEPWLRTSCDIDVLVRKSDVSGAVQALCNAGYEKEPDQTKHDHSFMTPGGVHVELHYDLNTHGYLAKADKILSIVWDYTTKVDGFRCNMTNEMFVFYHIAHMAKHFVHGGCGIRPIADLYVIRKKMPFDGKVLKDMLNKASMDKFYGYVSMLCDVWFEDKQHNNVTHQMEEFILTGGVYGTYENSATVNAANGESKIRSFLKLAFLSFENLSIIYPQLKKTPILFPFFQVKRWFGLLNKEKRKKIADITNARNIVEKADADKIKIMLENLNLNK